MRLQRGNQNSYKNAAEQIASCSQPEPMSGCWLWLGKLSASGYGNVTHGGRNLMAHRLAYETFVGPIPSGLELDHLCVTPCCVNPDHLEPVTQAENLRRATMRRTHCKHGHEYTPVNTRVRPDGARACRACARSAANRAWKRKPRLVTVRAPRMAPTGLRRTHCPKGHPYDESNSYIRKSDRGRTCRACQRQAQREYVARKKASSASA